MKANEYRKLSTQRELMRSVRKPRTPSTRVIVSKNTYNRKDQSWKDEG